MNLSLKGKRAIVCGSTQGIGKAIALMLSKQKAHITLVARDETKLKSVLKELDSSDNQEHNFIIADFQTDEMIECLMIYVRYHAFYGGDFFLSLTTYFLF